MGDDIQPGKPDPFSRLRAKFSLTETDEFFLVFEEDVRNKSHVLFPCARNRGLADVNKLQIIIHFLQNRFEKKD